MFVFSDPRSFASSSSQLASIRYFCFNAEKGKNRIIIKPQIQFTVSFKSE